MNNDKQNGVMVSTTQRTSNLFDISQFETMQRMGNMLASSELVPDIYQYQSKLIGFPENATEEQKQVVIATNNQIKNKAIANCIVALDLAQHIGASPLMVMQNMTVIHGKPSWSSKFLIATVNTCGRFNTLQYRFTEKGALGMVDYVEYVKEWVNKNGKGYYQKTPVNKQFDGKNIIDLECVAYTTIKGSTEVLESAPVSIRLAIQEGWFTKPGSKWQTMTRQMLMYRAASFWTSAYAPELSMGMRTIEENQDIIDVDWEEINDQPEKEKHDNANKMLLGAELASEVAQAESNVKEQQPEQPQEEKKPGF